MISRALAVSVTGPVAFLVSWLIDAAIVLQMLPGALWRAGRGARG